MDSAQIVLLPHPHPVRRRLSDLPPLKIYCAQCAHCAQSVKRLVLQWIPWAHLTQNRGISIVPTVPNFAPGRLLLIRLSAPRLKAFSKTQCLELRISPGEQ